MIKTKKGASIISLTICTVVVALVTTALVFANRNSAMYRAQLLQEKNSQVVEKTAYTKVYSLSEVTSIARQAYANNYLSFYDNEVDLTGFEALVIGEMMQQIPQDQLDNYNITVTVDGVNVEYK